MSLTSEQIQNLLSKETSQSGYPPPEQEGPLRQYEKEMRCANRGCGSSTFFKVNGIPRCMIHALRELNRLLTRPDEGNTTQ